MFKTDRHPIKNKTKNISSRDSIKSGMMTSLGAKQTEIKIYLRQLSTASKVFNQIQFLILVSYCLVRTKRRPAEWKNVQESEVCTHRVTSLRENLR